MMLTQAPYVVIENAHSVSNAGQYILCVPVTYRIAGYFRRSNISLVKF